MDENDVLRAIDNVIDGRRKALEDYLNEKFGVEGYLIKVWQKDDLDGR